MAWNTHPTISSGSTFTASDWNTYVKGNLDTLFPYTAVGQIAYSTSSASLAAITPSNPKTMVVTSTGVDSLSFNYSSIYRRQGGSSDWYKSPPSTVNTTPSKSVIQCGSIYVTSAANISFPVSFSTVPLVFLQRPYDTTFKGNVLTAYGFIGSVTTSGFNSGYGGYSFYLNWMAIGEI